MLAGACIRMHPPPTRPIAAPADCAHLCGYDARVPCASGPPGMGRRLPARVCPLCAELRSAPFHSVAHPAAAAQGRFFIRCFARVRCSTAFHYAARNSAQTGPGDARRLARFACHRALTRRRRIDIAPFRSVAWRHVYAYGARFPPRLGLRLASFPIHKSHYLHSRPKTGTR